MPRGRQTHLHISLSPDDRQILAHWQRQTAALQAGLARRARALQLVAAGYTFTEAARRVGRSRRFVYKWVRRFQADGVAGLYDQRHERNRRRFLEHA